MRRQNPDLLLVKYGVCHEKRQDMWRRRRDGGRRYSIKRPGLCDLTGLHTNEWSSVSFSSPYSPYPLFEQAAIHSAVLKYWSLHSLYTSVSLCIILEICMCLISTVFSVSPLSLHSPFFGDDMLNTH